MLKEWSRRRAARRVKPGNGRAVKRFRWWQPLSRALFSLTLDDGRQAVYTIDVHYFQAFLTESGSGRAHLYLDGLHHAESTLPAAFPVPGGIIEVVSTAFGLKRCHYVTTEGVEQQLVPDPASAEGGRARLDREHPALSRGIGVLSLVLLALSLLLLIPQVVEIAFLLPPVSENFGRFDSPIDLPVWVNIGLGLVTAAASTERASRLRHNWLLDSVG